MTGSLSKALAGLACYNIRGLASDVRAMRSDAKDGGTGKAVPLAQCENLDAARSDRSQPRPVHDIKASARMVLHEGLSRGTANQGWGVGPGLVGVSRFGNPRSEGSCIYLQLPVRYAASLPAVVAFDRRRLLVRLRGAVTLAQRLVATHILNDSIGYFRRSVRCAWLLPWPCGAPRVRPRPNRGLAPPGRSGACAQNWLVAADDIGGVCHVARATIN
jgi:hypothetical protein